MILTAQYDPLIDDGVNYAAQLRAAGNKVVYREYKDLFHGFFNGTFVSREAEAARMMISGTF
jgi:acetyl esterase